MATCRTCGAATQLYANDIPICLACVDALEAKPKPIQNGLQVFRAVEPPRESRH